ncbi:MAG: PKD domain-containing protein, partial [Candidatus Thermoplasmatota archaeon]|nr:PKD domain-containing protein [Candidatus Thermoplasmatota archaeon]
KWSENEEESWSSYQDSGTEIELSHLWNTTGTKQVKVQVEDSNHAVSKWYTIAVVSVYKYNITQIEEELVGLFTKTTAESHETLHFNAYEDGFIPLDVKIVSVSWSFGDESTASGIQVNHSYEKGGTYTITCVSITDDNQILSIDHTISISSEASLASVVNSLPIIWIGLFAVILVFLLFFYFVMIKKQISPQKIPSFIIQRLSKIGSMISIIKEKKIGLTLKNPKNSSHNFLGENIVPAWQESSKDNKPEIKNDWDEEVYKPMTFKGTYCEIMGKKIHEENLQDQLNKLDSEINSHDKHINGSQNKDDDTYDQSLEYKNN